MMHEFDGQLGCRTVDISVFVSYTLIYVWRQLCNGSSKCFNPEFDSLMI